MCRHRGPVALIGCSSLAPGVSRSMQCGPARSAAAARRPHGGAPRRRERNDTSIHHIHGRLWAFQQPTHRYAAGRVGDRAVDRTESPLPPASRGPRECVGRRGSGPVRRRAHARRRRGGCSTEEPRTPPASPRRAGSSPCSHGDRNSRVRRGGSGTRGCAHWPTPSRRFGWRPVTYCPPAAAEPGAAGPVHQQ